MKTTKALAFSVLFALSGPALASDCVLKKDGSLSELLASHAACSEELETESQEGVQTEKAVETQNKSPAATPSAGFASSLRSSIDNYLDLFSFALDDVTTSDDDQSLTIRFNPIRSGAIGSLGLSVTASKPVASEGLLSMVSEEQRAGIREALETGLDETDNLTYKGSFAFERKPGTNRRRWLLGRNPGSYRSLVENEIVPFLALRAHLELSSDDQVRKSEECSDKADRRLVENNLVGSDFDGNLQPISLSALETALDNDYEPCLEVWMAEADVPVHIDKKLDALARIPFLIDNQPQLTLTGELHDRASEVGRDGWNIRLSYEKGFANLNTLLRKTSGLRGDDLEDTFYSYVDDVTANATEAENRMTFSIAYAESDPYSFERTFGEGDDQIAVASSLDRSTEVISRFDYHRNATWHRMERDGTTVFPKFHLALEYCDVSDNPMRRDRLVGIATYEIPLPSGTTFPISLSYANHSQFLGDTDEVLSAHFGLSYKLPVGKKTNGN